MKRNANFLEMYHVARFLVENDKAKPFILAEKYSEITSVNDCNLDGITLLNKPTLIIVFLNKILNKAKSFYDSDGCYKKQKKHLSKRIQKRFIQCKKFLNMIQPISVVFRGDRHLGDGWEPAMIRACREKNIPRIVINYAYPTDIKEFIIKRRNRTDCAADLFPEIRDKYSHQVVFDEEKGRKYFYRPAFQIEALAENMMLPENPWVMGGSGCTNVLIDCESNKAQYIKNGVLEKKIIVTGNAAHDKLFNRFENKNAILKNVIKKYLFDSDKKLVIIAPMQLFEEKLLDKEPAMSEFEYLCSQFSIIDANCLLSLHPRMKKELYAPIAKKYELPIAEEPLSEILPAAHVFSAGYSTTVQWAVLCHIPTVIQNFYDFIGPIYHELKGVVAVGKEELLSTMRNILNDSAKYAELKKENVEQAGGYSPFDGKCVERIANALISLNS